MLKNKLSTKSTSIPKLVAKSYVFSRQRGFTIAFTSMT